MSNPKNVVIISKGIINKFIKAHPDCTESLVRWYNLAKEADWSRFLELKKTFSSTDYVGNDLYVFNIAGNRFRLIARIFFKVRTIYVKFIGTHAQYDKVKIADL